ncbi:MAG: ATP-binding protein [Clostridium sp.]|nr:ATP-binding protein [Clostridium sp.]
MENQSYKFCFIERILHLSQLLEERHSDIDRFLEGDWSSEEFSEEDKKELLADMEYISFMEEMPGGFFIYYADDDEQLIYANRGTLRMFLCDTMKEFRELTGNSFKGIVHPDDLEKVEASISRQVLSNQYDFDYVEYRIQRKDGTIHWVDDYGHLVRGGSMGDVFCVFLGDPSDNRLRQQVQQMEQMQVLSEAFEKADLAVKAKNAFLSQISHEMRTPLNAIFGFLTLAEISLNEPDVIADYLKQIETASRQLFNMITQALDVSALSNVTDSPEDECNLCDILQNVYDFLQPQAQEKNLSFALKCDKVTHQKVFTIPDRLQQMVLNLVNNAITYTKPGGRVEIILTEESIHPDNYSVYRLEVQDTGIGIDATFLERIFEPFSRESSSTLSGIQGIGLGLTIVKSIVDLLGGAISVKSTVNEGSTFTVTLPLQVHPDTAPPQKEKAPALRILLAEDNEINREIETELLERQGFFVDAVDGGRLAYEKIKNASPEDYDLILIDLQMPEMDGWEVATAVRSLPDPALAHIPIIALSANVQFEDRRKSLESGIDVHLPKPMDFTLLMDTIHKITKKTPFERTSS